MTGFAFLILLVLGMPIAFVLVSATFIFMFDSGRYQLLNSLPQILFSSLEMFDLLAIPLFILLGEAMNEGGITRRLIVSAQTWLRRVPNSLAYVCLVSNLMLASIMGSATAQIAVMSRVMVPAMEKDGYDRPFAAALTASAGMLAPLIPPSMIFIIYGVVAQVSIAHMFLAGILPGFLFFICLCIWVAIRSGARNRDGDEALATVSRGRATVDALATLTIPGVIVGGISFGIFTPTESAAIAIACAVVIGGFVYGELKWRQAPAILARTATNTALVLFLIAAAKLFGWVLTYNLVPQKIAAAVQAFTSDPTFFLLLAFLLMVFIGTILDGIAALIILIPILLPVAVGVYGLDPIHFGVVACLTLSLGLLTPPVGAGLFVASVAGDVNLVQLIRAIVPFVAIALFVILVIIFVPWLTSAFL